MGLPLVLLVCAVFVGVLLVVVFLLDRPSGGSRTGARLGDYIKLSSSPELSVETIGSGRQDESSVVQRLLAYAAITAPRKLRATASTDLARAHVRMSATRFLGIRGVLLVGAVLVAGLFILFSPQKSIVQWGIVGAGVLLAGRLPGIWLKRRIKANNRAIERALPYALDLLVACLEGGLSLEAALDKVASEGDSLLSQEIRRTLAEIALGRPNTEALRDLGERTGQPDLKRLTDTVVQADRMGISIAEAMRTLAEESRSRRRQRAEEEARKAPVKMLPILVLCTLPAVGAILMTPPIITLARVVTSFGHR
jgi:tight adherence protein C